MDNLLYFRVQLNKNAPFWVICHEMQHLNLDCTNRLVFSAFENGKKRNVGYFHSKTFSLEKMDIEKYNNRPISEVSTFGSFLHNESTSNC